MDQRFPSTHNAPSMSIDCLMGGGELGALMRSLDWSRTALGPPQRWPQSLRTSVSICLNSSFAMFIWWGPEFTLLYNDAYSRIIAGKHPSALGMAGSVCFPETWHIVEPMVRSVQQTGLSTLSEDRLVFFERHGFLEECYFTFSYSAIRDESGGVGGIFTPVVETTQQVLGARRMSTLRELASIQTNVDTASTAMKRAVITMALNPNDLPFVLLYLVNAEGTKARLSACCGVEEGSKAAPTEVELTPEARAASWPLARALRAPTETVLSSEEVAHLDLPLGVRQTAPTHVVIHPLRGSDHTETVGILVAGVSPHLPLDKNYRDYIATAASQVSALLVDARARAQAQQMQLRARTLFEGMEA